MLAKGYVLGNNTMSKAKSFDEKHQLTANASQLAANAQAKVVSLDNKIGITQKFSAGTAAINQQVKAVDEKFQVSEKTRTAVQVSGWVYATSFYFCLRAFSNLHSTTGHTYRLLTNCLTN